MPAQHFLDLFKNNPQSETLVRQGLRLLEGEHREQALLALADWERLETASTLAAVPELFPAIASLQRPSWGSWNGLLNALRKARNTLVRGGDAGLRSRLEQAADLNAVLARQEEAAEPGLVAGLDRLSKLVRSKLPGRPRLGQVLALPISLRNRMAHDMPSDPAWWDEAAGALRPLLGFHARAGAAAPDTLPATWFVVESDQVWSFNGIDHDGAVIYVSRQGATRTDPAAGQAVLLAFQRLLGKSDVQDRDFKKLLANLAPEEVKGVLFGDYLLGPPVGAGGFATVHVGRQLSTGRKVAIKVLRDGMDDEQRLRFQQEAAYLAQLDHPHIVSVLGHGEETWSPPRSFSLGGEAWFEQLRREAPIKSYIALEWIDGQTLDTLVRSTTQRPDVRTIAEWFAQAAEALAAVHGAGLIHRDLKPSNVMLTADGRIKLMDFGIARSQAESRTVHTATGQMLGTPAYMAPEQLTANEAQAAVGPLSDVYGVSATFYELFTGARLFSHDTLDHATVVTRKLAGEKPESPRRLAPGLPWEIATLVQGGLEREPKDRPESAADLAADLRRFLADRPIAYRTPTLRRRAMLFYRRNRRVANIVTPLLLGAALIASVFGVIAYQQGQQADVEQGKRIAEERMRILAEEKRQESEKQTEISQGEAKKSQSEATEADRRKRESDRHKILQKYIADMRLVPAMWKNDQAPEIRAKLQDYEKLPDDPRGFEWFYWSRVVNGGRKWHAPGRVIALEWSPDGNTLYAADVTGKLTAWDRASGKTRHVSEAGTRTMSVIAGADDMLALLSWPGGGSGGIHILKAGKVVRSFLPPNSLWVNDVIALNADNKRLYAGTRVGRIPSFDLETGKPALELVESPKNVRFVQGVRALSGLHNGGICGLAVSPKGDVVASGGEDGKIGLWSAAGPFLGWLRGHGGHVVSLAFSGDGTKLVSRSVPPRGAQANGGREFTPTTGEVIVWNLATAAKLRVIPLRVPLPPIVQADDGAGVPGGNYRALFVDADRAVIACDGNVVKTWDYVTGELKQERKGHGARIVSLALSPRQRLLASADDRGEVRVWNLDGDSQEETVLALDAPGRGMSLAGGKLAILRDRGDVFKKISFHAAPEFKAIEPEKASADGLAHAICSPSGRYAASVGLFPGKVIVWDTATNKIVHTIQALKGPSSVSRKRVGRVHCAAFRSDDEIYVVGEGILERINLKTQAAEEVTGVAVGSPLEWKDRFDMGRGTAGQYGKLVTRRETVMALAFSADGARAAFGTFGGEVAVYDAKTWEREAVLPGHLRGVSAVTFSGDGKRLATCSGRYYWSALIENDQTPGEIIIWDTQTWQSCLTLSRAEPHEFLGVAFADNDRTLYALTNRLDLASTVQPRGSLIRWDTRGDFADMAAPPAKSEKILANTILRSVSGRNELQMAGYEAIAIHPAGHLVAALTVHGRLVLWDVHTREIVREVQTREQLQFPLGRLTFSADGQRLLYFSRRRTGANVYSVPELSVVQERPQPQFTKVFDAAVGTGENPLLTAEFQQGEKVLSLVTASGARRLAVPIGLTAFSADAGYLLAVSKPEVRLVAVADGKVLFSTAFEEHPKACGFSGDGKTCYVITVPAAYANQASAPSARLQRWAVPSGDKQPDSAALRYPCVVSPDLQYALAAVDALNIHAIDLATGKRSVQPVAVQVLGRGTVFFPDSRHFATIGNQAQVHIWNVGSLVAAGKADPKDLPARPIMAGRPSNVPGPDMRPKRPPPAKVAKSSATVPKVTPPVPVKFNDVLGKARTRLLADLDRTLVELEKQQSAGKKAPVSFELLKNERLRFQKAGLIPWSLPLRPLSATYLTDLRVPAAAARDARVVARWRHQPGNGVNRFFSSGKINDPKGNHTWHFAKNKLILRWQDGRARGGFWIDTCDISADGLRYAGKNQNGTRVSGALVID